MSNDNEPFFKDGLNFSCTRCSACCRHEPGYVWLSRKDVEVLEKALKMGYNDLLKTYCRWVNGKLSLKEKANFDCIFWKDGCTVYGHRPLQCRAFPFWEYLMEDEIFWDAAAAHCPGMKRGTLHSADTIYKWLREQEAEPVVTRGN